MKKITYILIALILLISLTTINIFAEEVNKASIGQKIFAQAIENNEVTISNNEDEDFKEIDEIIGNCEITDEEMSEVVGEVGHASVFTSDPYGKDGGWNYCMGPIVYDYANKLQHDITKKIFNIIIGEIISKVRKKVVGF